jgi:F-type H+-transporting ATPase subunit b
MHFEPWTLGLQAANFLVLLWLLHRFLYRPILGIITARQAATDKLTSDLQSEREGLENQRQALERQQAALAAERETALAAMRSAAEAERKALLTKAQADADAVRAQAKTAFDRDRAEIVQAAGRDAARLAASIARRLLQEAAGPAIQARMLDRMCEDVRALPADTKQQIAGRLTGHDATLEVVTAEALDAAAAKDFGARLSTALGAPADPSFRVDAALIAGVEIHFPFTILRRTWAESLQRIEAELTHDDHASNSA